jgi:hypothetical protein
MRPRAENGIVDLARRSKLYRDTYTLYRGIRIPIFDPLASDDSGFRPAGSHKWRVEEEHFSSRLEASPLPVSPA